ncbi:MAG: MBL fold metallo-hydrolase [Planctomycetota bacterium]|nr:MBL fold metallo-hydrolase [Planctomycetota bacterium]
MDLDRLQIRVVVSALFQQNTFVAWRPGRRDCLLVDPGLEPDQITRLLDAEKLHPAAILNTHGHSDHIGGNQAVKQRWPQCPIVIGEAEAGKLSDPAENLSLLFGARLVSPPADKTVADGERFSAAGFDLKVIAIPGQSAGHVVFLVEGQAPCVVFVGDVIFAGSIGRTDFPDGDFAQLAAGIRQKLFPLPDDTILLPGHGPETTVGQERRTNPFVGENAGGS